MTTCLTFAKAPTITCIPSGKFENILIPPTAEKMINFSLTSHLYYCNCLLYVANGYFNISATVHSVQCHLDASPAPQIRPYSTSFKGPTLASCSTKNWIEYVAAPLLSSSWYGKAPAHVNQLLSLYTPNRRLRSETIYLRTLQRCSLEGFCRRYFACVAPSFWNLPTSVIRASYIDAFKSSMKTYLFNMAYPSNHWLLLCTTIL